MQVNTNLNGSVRPFLQWLSKNLETGKATPAFRWLKYAVWFQIENIQMKFISTFLLLRVVLGSVSLFCCIFVHRLSTALKDSLRKIEMPFLLDSCKFYSLVRTNSLVRFFQVKIIFWCLRRNTYLKTGPTIPCSFLRAYCFGDLCYRWLSSVFKKLQSLVLLVQVRR